MSHGVPRGDGVRRAAWHVSALAAVVLGLFGCSTGRGSVVASSPARAAASPRAAVLVSGREGLDGEGPKPGWCPESTLPRYVTAGPPHAAVIERGFANPEEECALRLAEQAVPGAFPDPLPVHLLSDSADALSFGIGAKPAWWGGEIHGVRVPLAITEAAVSYFLAFGKPRTMAGGPVARVMLRTSLRYTATVHANRLPGRHNPETYNVDMALEWSGECGAGCDLSIQAWRKVFVRPEGVIVGVSGDGVPRLRGH